MEKFKCQVCGYIYDPSEGEPQNGIESGTPFSDLPSDYLCPVCSAGKDDFFSCD
ncbi:MAG TPA: rubredoxin [Bacteroidales bacterium]|nr:rubredoxin [Bacteroidales bacterium]